MTDRDQILRQVSAALTDVKHPGTGEDVLSAGRVRELDVDDEGRVHFHFFLQADDPGTLVRETRAAVEGVDGVSAAKIDVKLPRSVQAESSGGGPGAGTGGGAPGAGAGGTPAGGPPGGGGGLKPGSVPAPTPQPGLLPGVRHIVAVSSGKGGVGKSTLAVNLAASLNEEGHRVGLLDADVYGPDIPLMFGETRRPKVSGTRGQEKIVPLEAQGIRLMSLGFLLEEDQPAIMRGPLISGILKQFLEQVEWGDLDYLIVDMPPGTGDAQLSLAQTINVDGALMVTTPQDVSIGDVRRGIRMWERVETRVLGIVENMAGFTCPGCGENHLIFGEGGGRSLAAEMDVPFLGSIPIDTEVRVASDSGTPTATSAPDSPAGSAFREVAREVVATVEEEVVAGA